MQHVLLHVREVDQPTFAFELLKSRKRRRRDVEHALEITRDVAVERRMARKYDGCFTNRRRMGVGTVADAGGRTRQRDPRGPRRRIASELDLSVANLAVVVERSLLSRDR